MAQKSLEKSKRSSKNFGIKIPISVREQLIMVSLTLSEYTLKNGACSLERTGRLAQKNTYTEQVNSRKNYRPLCFCTGCFTIALE